MRLRARSSVSSMGTFAGALCIIAEAPTLLRVGARVLRQLLRDRRRGGLFLAFVRQLPHKARFGSFGDSAAAESAGFMFHNILQKSLNKCFLDWEAGHVEPIDNEDDPDERKKAQRKIHHARCFVNDRLRAAKLTLAAWASEALDCLWLRLEAMDHAGNALRDLACDHTSPVRPCMAQLAFVLCSAPLDSTLAAVFHHWRDEADEVDAGLVGDARGLFASMLLQLWCSCILEFEDWPYKFCGIGPGRSGEEQRAQVRDFYSLPACCLDELFSSRAPDCVLCQSREIRICAAGFWFLE